MKRSAPIRRTELKRGTSRLRFRSARKTQQMRAAKSQLERLIEERGNRCEVCPIIRTVVPTWKGCAGWKNPVEGRHHLKKQSALGADSDANVLLSCNLANSWVENNPYLADSTTPRLVRHSWEPDL